MQYSVHTQCNLTSAIDQLWLNFKSTIGCYQFKQLGLVLYICREIQVQCILRDHAVYQCMRQTKLADCKSDWLYGILTFVE